MCVRCAQGCIFHSVQSTLTSPFGRACQTSAHCFLGSTSSSRVRSSSLCLLQSATFFPKITTLFLLFRADLLLQRPCAPASLAGRGPEKQEVVSVESRLLQICSLYLLRYRTTAHHHAAPVFPPAPRMSVLGLILSYTLAGEPQSVQIKYKAEDLLSVSQKPLIWFALPQPGVDFHST